MLNSMQREDDLRGLIPTAGSDSREDNPLVLPAPEPGNPSALRQFTTIAQWHAYLNDLHLSGDSPGVLRRDYDYVLRVLSLAWWDSSVIKLAELAALARLEVAIAMRYPEKKFRSLEAALRHLVKHSGMTSADLRSYGECGGATVENLLKDKSSSPGSSLSEIRNRLTHGDQIETMSWSWAGLFEVVRDLIDFMYPPSPGAVP